MKRINLLAMGISIGLLCLGISISGCQKSKESNLTTKTVESTTSDQEEHEPEINEPSITANTKKNVNTVQTDSTNDETKTSKTENSSNPEKIIEATDKSETASTSDKNNSSSSGDNQKNTSASNNKTTSSSLTSQKIDSSNSSGNTSNNNSNSASSTISSGASSSGSATSPGLSPSSGSSASASKPSPTTAQTPAHSHTWVDITDTVYQEAETKTETKVVQEAWTEEVPVYEEKAIEVCSFCKEDITDETSAHLKKHALNGENVSRYTDYIEIQTGTTTIEHPAVTEEITVVVKEAYTETVITGQKCSSCGTTK